MRWTLLLGFPLVFACASTVPDPFPPPAPLMKPKAAAVAPVAPPPVAAAAAAPTEAEAREWLRKTDAEFKRLAMAQQKIAWVNETFITTDTNDLAAEADQVMMEATARAIKESRRFAGVTLPPQEARMMKLLGTSTVLMAPDNAQARAELAKISTDLKTLYSTGKLCLSGDKPAGKKAKGKKAGKDDRSGCLDLVEIGDRMRTTRDYDTLLELWEGWHKVARPMRALYARQVELANQGAKEIGFADNGELWRSRYDMTPGEFAEETERLWGQVKPLYDQLHCYVRKRLSEKYGADKVPMSGPIPAHLLGNMWAQEWGNIYSLVEPYPKEASLDVTKAMEKSKWDALKMVRVAEGFYTSLGLKPLPKTFWERSMFLQPKDREVVCHASAWDLDYDQDVRIKMCIRVTDEDLVTIHHELGHNYYQFYYPQWPMLLQDGAHDGFHEAIGDAVALSVTPSYLKQIGLFPTVPKASEKARVNQQLKDALEKIAFLPFGLLIDRWRWEVFSGKITPDRYNASWWELRRKYQGIAPAGGARGEDSFDPGAKYHVSASVPYMRYFLARILQFQFHRAMCKASGHTGPLDQCSVYGNKAAGEPFKKMLEMGASQPWPEALAALTGERRMDAGAMLEYFAPLQKWLTEQNRGQSCGW
jgi:peptidyl-dipeptidase A